MMLKLNAREQAIRLAILRAIRTHRNDLVSTTAIQDYVLSHMTAMLLEVEYVLTVMDDAGELYHTDSFGGRRFYGIKSECSLADCQRVCLKAEEVERVVTDALNSLPRSERALLLARLHCLLDEVANLPE